MNLEDVLVKNRPLKNIHAGKRCFLVGNGPSLGNQDISLLKDEVAIVATSFFRHVHAKEINPAYWVIADPYFWQQPEQFFVPMFDHAVKKNVATTLYAPTGGFNYLAGFKRSPLIDLSFYHYDHSQGINTPIDFSRGIPPYGQNVMTVCLMLAFYLGCNPIYFIGCDRDYWNVTREEYEAYAVDHFYPEPGKKVRCSECMPWGEWLRAKERTDWEYAQLRQYATVWGFDVYNATHGGYFDDFPRIQYESLFIHSVDLLGESQSHNSIADIRRLAHNAAKLMNEGEATSALFLLEAALNKNINTRNKMDGLEYLMALCLAKLKIYDRAMIFARQELTRNPGNQEKTLCLIQQLENYI